MGRFTEKEKGPWGKEWFHGKEKERCEKGRKKTVNEERKERSMKKGRSN